MNKLISKFAATALLAVTAIVPSFAQSNLGAACGCPPVATRPTVLVSTLAVNGGASDGNLLANTVFDCSKTWILDKKIYVPNGLTLTIMPGTVIKGRDYPGQPSLGTALTVSVGGKINAQGTDECQIVFTAEADPLDGTYAISNIGKWGGVCIAGKATNNLTLAANGPFDPLVSGKLAVADGLGTFEGFASTNVRDQFGVQTSAPVNGVFDDNDNSGVFRYVSLRHTGAILTLGGEINALTLGSVGRGTQIDHIEVVSGADDGIEMFGGTVNIKYCAFLFMNDDNIDWDLGWKGNAQFLYVQKTDNTASLDADNGMECDADDQKSNLLPRSHPIIYNATMIGNSKTTTTTDNSGISAIRAKELTEGEIYNSIFANWRYGLNITKAIGTRPNTAGQGEAYANWSTTSGNGSNSLKVQCNTFTGMINRTLAIDNSNTASLISLADSTQFFTTDKNTSVASIAGFSAAFTVNNTTNAFTVKPDPYPSAPLSVTGCPVSADPFFTAAPYRGAFAPGQESWLSGWTYAAALNSSAGVSACPTDLNKDGITNNVDFLQLLGQFGQSCP